MTYETLEPADAINYNKYLLGLYKKNSISNGRYFY